MLVILFDDLSPPSYSSIHLDRSIVIRFDRLFFLFLPPILSSFNQEKCRFSNAGIELWMCVSVGHVSRLWNDAIPVVKIVKGHIGNEQGRKTEMKNRGWISRDF